MDAQPQRAAAYTVLLLPLAILAAFLSRDSFALVLRGSDHGSSLEAAISALANDYGFWTPFISTCGALTGYAVWRCIAANENRIEDAIPENDAPPLRLHLRRRRDLWLAVTVALGSAAFLSSFGAHEVLRKVDIPICPIGTRYAFYTVAPCWEDQESWQVDVALDADLEPVIYRSAWLRTAIALNLTDDRIPDDSLNPNAPPPYADGPGRVGHVVYPSMRTGGFGLNTHMLDIPGFPKYAPLPPGGDPLERRPFLGVAYSHASGPRFVSLDAVVMRTNISVDCADDSAHWSLGLEYESDLMRIFKGERHPRRGGFRENYFVIRHLRTDPIMRMTTWTQAVDNPEGASKSVHQIIVLTFIDACGTGDRALVLDFRYGGNDVIQKAEVTDPSKPIVPGDQFIPSDELSYWVLWAAAKRIDTLLGLLPTMGRGDGGAVAKAMVAAGIDKAMRGGPYPGDDPLTADMAPLLSDILTDAAQGFYSLMRQGFEVDIRNRDRETPLGHSTLRYISKRIGQGTWFGPGMLLISWALCLVSCARCAIVTSLTAGGRDIVGTALGERDGYRILDGGEIESESERDSSLEG